jgi:hypothetical protein
VLKSFRTGELALAVHWLGLYIDQNQELIEIKKDRYSRRMQATLAQLSNPVQ